MKTIRHCCARKQRPGPYSPTTKNSFPDFFLPVNILLYCVTAIGYSPFCASSSFLASSVCRDVSPECSNGPVSVSSVLGNEICTGSPVSVDCFWASFSFSGIKLLCVFIRCVLIRIIVLRCK